MQTGFRNAENCLLQPTLINLLKSFNTSNSDDNSEDEKQYWAWFMRKKNRNIMSPWPNVCIFWNILLTHNAEEI